MKVDLTEAEIKILSKMMDMVQVTLAEAPDLLVLRGKIKDVLQDKP